MGEKHAKRRNPRRTLRRCDDRTCLSEVEAAGMPEISLCCYWTAVVGESRGRAGTGFVAAECPKLLANVITRRKVDNSRQNGVLCAKGGTTAIARQARRFLRARMPEHLETIVELHIVFYRLR